MSKYIPNSHQTPNVLVDEIMHLLTESELKCYLFAIRHVYGWQDKIERGYAHISLSMFQNGFSTFSGTGLARSTVSSAIDSLVEYRLLLKMDKSTRNGQAYAIGENPDIDGLNLRKSGKKSTGSNSELVGNSNQQQYEIATVTSSKFEPKQTQDKTQEQTAPKNGEARPRDEVFDWLAQNIYQQRADGTIPKSIGGRVAKTKRVLCEIHDANGTDITVAHLDKFRQWWLRAYSGLTMPRSAEKLVVYYNEFYQSHKTVAQPQQQQYDLTVQAQIELGYDTITPNLMNDEIREYLETMTPWT